MTANTERSTWNDERREVWQSVAEAMRAPDLDEDRASACRYLLSHLSACPRPAWRASGSDVPHHMAAHDCGSYRLALTSEVR